jgi:dTDP-4-amino-4,6-dideoxygalactose transaminase
VKELDALRLALMAMGFGEGDKVIARQIFSFAILSAVSQSATVPIPIEPTAFAYSSILTESR